jgi:hypothetical protein
MQGKINEVIPIFSRETQKMVLILVFSQNSSCRKTTLALKNLKITTKVRAHLLFAEHPVLTERRSSLSAINAFQWDFILG